MVAVRHEHVIPEGSSPDSVDWREWNADHVITGSIGVSDPLNIGVINVSDHVAFGVDSVLLRSNGNGELETIGGAVGGFAANDGTFDRMHVRYRDDGGEFAMFDKFGTARMLLEVVSDIAGQNVFWDDQSVERIHLNYDPTETGLLLALGAFSLSAVVLANGDKYFGPFVYSQSGANWQEDDAIWFTGLVSLQGAQVEMPNLPSADPAVPGQVYRTGGALMVSL